MFVIVVGGTPIGVRVAEALARRGAQVALVDVAAPALPGVTRVQADGATPAGLQQAGAGRADLVVAATGSDASNLVAAALAREEFGVPRVLACIDDPAQAWLYASTPGIDAVVDDADLLVRFAVEELALGDIDKLAALRRGGYTLLETTVPADSQALGLAVTELTLPADCTPFVLFRAGRALSPRGAGALQAGDAMLVSVRRDQVAALVAALGPRSEPVAPLEVVAPSGADAAAGASPETQDQSGGN